MRLFVWKINNDSFRPFTWQPVAILNVGRVYFHLYLSEQWRAVTAVVRQLNFIYKYPQRNKINKFYVNKAQKFLSIRGSALLPLFYQLLLNIVVAHSLRKCCTSQLSTVTVATSRWLQIAFCVALPNILTAPPGLGSATFFIGLLVTVLEGHEKERMLIEQ